MLIHRRSSQGWHAEPYSCDLVVCGNCEGVGDTHVCDMWVSGIVHPKRFTPESAFAFQTERLHA